MTGACSTVVVLTISELQRCCTPPLVDERSGWSEVPTFQYRLCYTAHAYSITIAPPRYEYTEIFRGDTFTDHKADLNVKSLEVIIVIHIYVMRYISLSILLFERPRLTT